MSQQSGLNNMYRLYADNKLLKTIDDPLTLMAILDNLILNRVNKYNLIVIKHDEQLDMDSVDLLYSPASSRDKYLGYRKRLLTRYVENENKTTFKL